MNRNRVFLISLLDETQNDNECEEDDPASTELRFVPDDKSTSMYSLKFLIYSGMLEMKIVHVS